MKKNDGKQSPQKGARPLSDATRRPAAPLGHPLTRAKPEEPALPAAPKHKHRLGPEGHGG